MSKTFKTPKGTELPILDLRKKDYLEVKYRLVWFREEHPTWGIETQIISITEKSAYTKATIKDETGRVIATSHKFEDAAGFPDFMEKAETGAIGRALALVGFGTQFCADDLDEGARIVDAPVAQSQRPPQVFATPPVAGDGVHQPETHKRYTVPFGKYSKRALHEIDRGELINYCDYLENKAAEDPSKPMSANAVEFLTRAKEWIALSQQDDITL